MSGIYIHIPFCSHKCRYCNFFSKVANNETIINSYIDALCVEIENNKNYLQNPKIETIYFGGGTPSVLKIDNLEKIFSTISKYFDISSLLEVTLEANPENLSQEYLNDLKKYTIVNRLSIGFQSFFDDELMFTNRKHTANKSVAVVNTAKSIGFENITGDLIYGLPFQTLDKWQKNLDIFFSLEVPHLSAYHLSIEEGTVFGMYQKKGKIVEIDEELSIKMYELLIETAEKNNFNHYEISNFAKNNFKSLHNSNYWKGVEYLGVGASAHSYNCKSRRWNISNIEKYIELISQKKSYSDEEFLSEKDFFNEFILTGLRTSEGINLNVLQNKNSNFYNQIKKELNQYISKGLVLVENGFLKLSKQGIFISDSIISDFIIL